MGRTSKESSKRKKSFGDQREPAIVGGKLLERMELLNAYNDYHCDFTQEDAVQFLADHFEKLGELDIAEKFRRFNVAPFIVPTIAWLCRMIDRGAIINEDSQRFYNNKMAGLRELASRTDFDEVDMGETKIKRKNKRRSPEDLAPNFLDKFEDENGVEYTSIPWKRIEKSSELWTYNTKTRMLCVYKSQSMLGVKGTTLQNVDYAVARKLRKPEEILGEMIDATKQDCETMFKSLTTKPATPKTRLNKDTLLFLSF